MAMDPVFDKAAAEPVEHATTLSEDIVAVFEDGSGTVGELIDKTATKGFGFLLVVFGFPNALPLPPGAATPFGIVLVLLCYQMVLGREKPWFPDWVMKRKLGGTSSKFLIKLGGLLKKFERFLKPRQSWVFHATLFRVFIAPVMLFAACCITLPLPGTNSVPSLGVGLVGLGMLEEDGWFGMVGTAIVVAGAGIAVAAIWVAREFILRSMGM